jgi:hypothetical protein
MGCKIRAASRIVPAASGIACSATQETTRSNLPITHGFQAHGISDVIHDTKALLLLSLPCSRYDRSRGIHTRDLRALPSELTGERAVAAAYIEYALPDQRTQHPGEGWMQQRPMPVAALVSLVFLPMVCHLLPTLGCRHAKPPCFTY